MKLTETLAIIISRDLWLWLSEKPGRRYKHEYPLFYELGIDDMSNQCPCCAYYHMEWNYETCLGCPLKSCERGSDWFKWVTKGRLHLYAYSIYKTFDDTLNSMEEFNEK